MYNLYEDPIKKQYIESIIDKCNKELIKSFINIEWDWDINYIFITATYDENKSFNVDISIKDISFEVDDLDDNVDYVMDTIYDTFEEKDTNLY